MNTRDTARGHSVGPGMNTSDPADGYGTLTVAAVPIGRPGDASPLLAQALAEAPLVAAEDTRRLRRLAATLGVEVTGRVVSYWDAASSGSRGDQLLDSLRQGQDVLLVSDAGMPAISDPGYRLVAAAAEAGARVRVLPGPSAVTAALAVSGPAHRPVLLRGVPAPQGRRAGPPLRRAGRRATDPGLLRVRQAGRGHPGRAGRGVRARTAGGGLPRADQDPRGSPPGHAGRAGRLGRGRPAGRGHPGRRGRPGRAPAHARRRRRPRWPAGPRAASRGARRSPRWPGSPACAGARCTTPWWRPATRGRRNPFGTCPPVPLGWTHVRDDPSHPDRARLAVRQRAPPHRPCLRLRPAVRHVQPVPADGGEPGADGQRHRRARDADPGRRRRRGADHPPARRPLQPGDRGGPARRWACPTTCSPGPRPATTTR